MRACAYCTICSMKLGCSDRFFTGPIHMIISVFLASRSCQVHINSRSPSDTSRRALVFSRVTRYLA